MRASPLVQRAHLFLVRADHFQSQSLPFPTRILTALSQLVPQVLVSFVYSNVLAGCSSSLRVSVAQCVLAMCE